MNASPCVLFTEVPYCAITSLTSDTNHLHLLMLLQCLQIFMRLSCQSLTNEVCRSFGSQSLCDFFPSGTTAGVMRVSVFLVVSFKAPSMHPNECSWRLVNAIDFFCFLSERLPIYLLLGKVSALSQWHFHLSQLFTRCNIEHRLLAGLQSSFSFL